MPMVVCSFGSAIPLGLATACDCCLILFSVHSLLSFATDATNITLKVCAERVQMDHDGQEDHQAQARVTQDRPVRFILLSYQEAMLDAVKV